MALHLLGHAVFKSMLFMLVGILLHATGMQDSRSLPATVCRVLRPLETLHSTHPHERSPTLSGS